MKFSIEREALLKPLQLVAGIVESRQTLPILSNILIDLNPNELILTGTDLEVELQAKVKLLHVNTPGRITVPARKFVDICRTLPEQTQLEIYVDGTKLIIRAGRSRFSLATLPADEFPNTEEVAYGLDFQLPQASLHQLMENTTFAMAQQDVRYYLNGMLFEVGDNCLRCVATDGHRMAFSSIEINTPGMAQIIIPRKCILELSRLLVDSSENVLIQIGANQLRIKTSDYTFTSKLIDGQFPNYDKVIPTHGDKILIVDRDTLKHALNHVAILANEKHRAVCIELRSDTLRLVTNNPNQEQAEETFGIEYQGSDLDTGFNVSYLLDVVSALPSGDIKLTLADPDSSVRIEQAQGGNSIYVVMPMRL